MAIRNGLVVADVFISTNVDQVLARLDDVGKRQFPFAFSLALNRSAEEARDAVRQRIHQRGFTVRSAVTGAWLDKHIVIPPSKRSTKKMLRVQLRVSPPGLKNAKYSAMPWLETAGTRVGTRPIGSGGLFARAIAIPYRKLMPLRIIPRELYPSHVGLAPRRDIDGSMYVAGRGKKSRRKVKLGLEHLTLRGSDRTFALPDRKHGRGAGYVFQRVGKGRDGAVPLFTIRPQIRVDPRAYFMSTARRIFRDRLPANTVGFLIHALRTAK